MWYSGRSLQKNSSKFAQICDRTQNKKVMNRSRWIFLKMSKNILIFFVKKRGVLLKFEVVLRYFRGLKKSKNFCSKGGYGQILTVWLLMKIVSKIGTKLIFKVFNAFLERLNCDILVDLFNNPPQSKLRFAIGLKTKTLWTDRGEYF